MDQQGAAVRHPSAPLRDVLTRRAVAMCAVDVQHVDHAVDGPERLVRERPQVRHPGHAPRRVSGWPRRQRCRPRLLDEPLDLLRTAVVAPHGGRWRTVARPAPQPTPARSCCDHGSCRSRRSCRRTDSAERRRRAPRPGRATSSPPRRRPRARTSARVGTVTRRTPRGRRRSPRPGRAAGSCGPWRRSPRAPSRGPGRERARSGAVQSASARSRVRRTATSCR